MRILSYSNSNYSFPFLGKIKYLPVHKPSKYEKETPLLFAANVRARIARALNIPTTGSLSFLLSP